MKIAVVVIVEVMQMSKRQEAKLDEVESSSQAVTSIRLACIVPESLFQAACIVNDFQH